MKILTIVATPNLDSIPKFENSKAGVELKTLSLEQLSRASTNYIPDIVLISSDLAHYEHNMVYDYINKLSLGKDGYKNIKISFV